MREGNNAGMRRLLTPEYFAERPDVMWLGTPLTNVQIGKETVGSRTLYTLQYQLPGDGGGFVSQEPLYLEVVPSGGGYQIQSINTSP